jgi:hypothetical protein
MAQLNCGISLRLLGSEDRWKNPVASANTLDRGDRSERCRLRPQEVSAIEGQNARKAASSSAIQLRVSL